MPIQSPESMNPHLAQAHDRSQQWWGGTASTCPFCEKKKTLPLPGRSG
jgi:hypothetical protein